MEGFCENCGTELVNGVCPRCSGTGGAPDSPQTPDPDAERYKSIFLDPKEKFVCALGNGYLQSFLTKGTPNRGFAVVSDKRVYFKGDAYEIGEKNPKLKKVTKTVDLKDITGIEIKPVEPAKLIEGAIFLFIGIGIMMFGGFNTDNMFGGFSSGGNYNIDRYGNLIRSFDIMDVIKFLATPGFMGIVFGIVGFFIIGRYLASSQSKAMIKIMSGIGGVAFPLKWYSVQEREEFQRMLTIAKDNAVNQSGQAAANTMHEVMSNAVPLPVASTSADELAKYAQLYKDGLISDQEFADIKSKLLTK